MAATITFGPHNNGRDPWARGVRRLLRWCSLALVSVMTAVTVLASVYVATTSWDTVPGGLSFVRTGAYETRFEPFGATSKTPIVLLHGAFESVDTWRPVAQLLAKTHHVEAYDLAGYGYTERVGPYTTEGLAAQLASFLRVRHLDHPILVGHSLGAGVIAQFLLDHPRAASGVVFVDGDGLALSIFGSRLMTMALGDPYRTALYRAALQSDWFLQQIWSATCGPHCPALTSTQLDGIRRPLLIPGALGALMDIATRPIVGVSANDIARVGRQRVPALVVFGALDPEYPSGAAEQTALRLGARRPVIIAGASHQSIWSNPVQVATAIDAFVAKPSCGRLVDTCAMR